MGLEVSIFKQTHNPNKCKRYGLLPFINHLTLLLRYISSYIELYNMESPRSL